jgi:hypothetical protein
MGDPVKPEVLSEQVASQQPPEISTQPPSTPPKRRRQILGCLAIALGLFLACLRAWGWSFGMMDAQAWGYAAGSAILPALIAYAIAGRKSVRDFNRFGLWFSGLSLAFFAVAGGKPVTLQQHVAGLMKEAAGTKPMSSAGPNIDNLIREMLRMVLDDRKVLDQESTPFEPSLSKIYSAESFANPDAIRGMIDAVHGIAAVDARYSKKLESIPDRMQTYVDASTMSDSDKKDFIAGVRSSYGNEKAIQIRRQAMEAEQKWEAESVGLYEFALKNMSKIRARGEGLIIADRHVRNEFNARLETAEKLRDEIVKLNSDLETAQKAALQEAGLTPTDLGLPSTDKKK